MAYIPVRHRENIKHIEAALLYPESVFLPREETRLVREFLDEFDMETLISEAALARLWADGFENSVELRIERFFSVLTSFITDTGDQNVRESIHQNP
jgi:hypothetical protein